jgi:hypothetical protein
VRRRHPPAHGSRLSPVATRFELQISNRVSLVELINGLDRDTIR